MGVKYTPAKALPNWDWAHQDKWGGNCNSKIMQSPININIDSSGISTLSNLQINYNFANRIPFVVTSHGEEVIVKFDKNVDTGYMKIQTGTVAIPKMKRFKPTGLSFRFPAEHMVQGNRFDGEIILEFQEVTHQNDPVNMFK